VCPRGFPGRVSRPDNRGHQGVIASQWDTGVSETKGTRYIFCGGSQGGKVGSQPTKRRVGLREETSRGLDYHYFVRGGVVVRKIIGKTRKREKEGPAWLLQHLQTCGAKADGRNGGTLGGAKKSWSGSLVAE